MIKDRSVLDESNPPTSVTMRDIGVITLCTENYGKLSVMLVVRRTCASLMAPMSIMKWLKTP